jgi:hypothetical protein
MKKLWEKIKLWVTSKALPWLKSAWMQIVNVFVVLLAYSKLDDLGSGATWFVGLWGFVLLAYYIFWKLFGASKLFEKKKG